MMQTGKLGVVDTGSTAKWVEKPIGDIPLISRMNHTSIFLDNNLFVIGGDCEVFKYHVYDFNKSQWSEGKTPFGLKGHTTSVFTREDDSTVFLVYGGTSRGNKVSGDLFEGVLSKNSKSSGDVIIEWSLVTYNEEMQPPPRTGHSAILSNDNKFQYIFGGFSWIGGKSVLVNAIHRYDVNERVWKEMTSDCPSFSPQPRSYHSAILLRKTNKMLIGCGRDGRKRFSDFWTYDLDSNEWTEVEYENQEKIVPRSFQQMIVLKNEKNEDESVLLGPGYYSLKLDLSKHTEEELTSFWSLNLDTKQPKWEMIPCHNNKKILYRYSMNQISDTEILMFGGCFVDTPKVMKGKFRSIAMKKKQKDFQKFGCLSVPRGKKRIQNEEEEGEEEYSVVQSENVKSDEMSNRKHLDNEEPSLGIQNKKEI